MHIQLSEPEYNLDGLVWSDVNTFLVAGGFDCTTFDTVSASVSGAAVSSACSYTVNTGTASAGSAVNCTCFQAAGTGSISNCPVHPSLTVNPWVITSNPSINPSVSNNFTFTTIEDKCGICRDVIEMADVLGGYKACKDCRRAIEAFKAVLVCEKEEKEN